MKRIFWKPAGTITVQAKHGKAVAMEGGLLSIAVAVGAVVEGPASGQRVSVSEFRPYLWAIETLTRKIEEHHLTSVKMRVFGKVTVWS